MLDSKGRPGVNKAAGSVGRTLAGIGFTPNWITLIGLVLAGVAGVAVAQGRLLLGFVVGFTCSVMDLLDGAVAKARGGGTRRGAFFDSVADRLADAMLLGGCAWYLLEQGSRWGAVAAVVCIVGGNLVSYTRAKAEELGFNAHVGLLERAERLMILGLGVLLQQWWNVLPAFLTVLAVLTFATALHRFLAVWRQGEAEPPLPIEEIRVLPDLKSIRIAVVERDDDEPVSQAVRLAWEHQRAVRAERRAAAAMRRRARRAEEDALRARLRDGRSPRSRAATGRAHRQRP